MVVKQRSLGLESSMEHPRQMAIPQDELEQCTPLFETCDFPDAVRETMNARGLVRGPLLWDTIFVYAEEKGQIKCDDQTFNSTGGNHGVKWWGEIVHSLDWLCEESWKECEGSGSGHEFSLDSLKEEMICLHREGSFNLRSPGAVACCLHVACVICRNCVRLCLRIDSQSTDSASLIVGYSGLTDHCLSGSSKKRSADRNKKSFDQWSRYFLKDYSEDSEEAMKLLHQWTLLPLQAVLRKVDRLMDGYDYAYFKRVSEWGCEVCDFLEESRGLFVSDDIDFLYDIIFRIYRRTALLQRRMGNEKRTAELLLKLADMLENVWSYRDDLMITECEKGKITYINPNPIQILDRKMEVRSLQGSEDFGDLLEMIREEREGIKDECGLVPGFKLCNFFGSDTSRYGGQINWIISALGHERFSEARECFEQVDLNDKELHASFRDFLHGALTDTNIAPFIVHSCVKSPFKWESVCAKQDFCLDVCEALGDRQLTAKYLLAFGERFVMHSIEKFEECIQDAPKLKVRLEEELNLLQLSSPEPEHVQELKSCLSDPCKPDEHKRDNLPDTLKAYRLLKRSIDIYSDLLQNWTQRNSNEVEWLQLLESQKGAHDMLLSFLLVLCTFCYKTLMKSNNLSVGANNYLVPCSKKRRSALNHAFLALSESILVWAERGHARTLLNQLGPWYHYMKKRDGDPGSLKEELHEFDNNQEAALSSIISCRLVCKGEPLFVEYVSQTLINSESWYMNRNNGLAYLIHMKAQVLEGVMLHFNGDEVEKLVNDFYKTVDDYFNEKEPQRRSLYAGFAVKLHGVLEKLYDMLIEPLLERLIFKHLDPGATVIFVPDKILYRVPFALLRDKRTQKHLFQLHPISVAPSLRVLQHCERRLRDLEKSQLKPEGCILAVGNAVYEKDRLLPGTAKELEHLRSCFPGRVKTLEKDEATRAKFLELVKEASDSTEQHAFACIHLGVHGHWKKDASPDTVKDGEQYKMGSLEFANPPQRTGGSRGSTTDISSSDLGTRQSLTSGLEQQLPSEAATISSNCERYGSAFGEVGAVMRAEGYSLTAKEDMLQSEDIVKGGFQWRTRLAVLSACNSSRGQAYTDGEANLPRALMIAGVPATVVSQWKIDDCGSAALMKAFYENLRYGQDVATALQSAMIRLSDSKSANNIFEWGAFLVWGLPTVEFPKELWTENAIKMFPARQISYALIYSVKSGMLKSVKPDKMKVSLLHALMTVKSFLERATYNACVLGKEAIADVIVATELQLRLSHRTNNCPDDAIDLAEKVYAVLPLELLERVETESICTHFWDELRNSSDFEFDKRPGDLHVFKVFFWRRIMYTQAMKGSHRIALEYANKMIEVIQNAYRCGCDESRVKTFREDEKFARQERAVILRLMGRYEEALKEFKDILALGENYECLIQMSYLKDLMEDKSGALEYGRRAKILEFDAPLRRPGRGAFLLCFKALPYKYREWLLSKSCSVRSLPTVQLPKELWTENARKAVHAKHLAELLRPKLDAVIEWLGCFFDGTVVDNAKVHLSTCFKNLNNFLESASGSIACVFEEEDIRCTLHAVEYLLEFSTQCPVSKGITELAAEVYAILPFDQLQRLERKLVRVGFESLDIRQRIMYTEAMKGSHQTALEYANKMIEARQNTYACGCHELGTQALRAQEEFVRQERAVILRLMGKYDEALKELDDILALGENYECLIQTSYLKHLMEDKGGALEYARRAKKVQDDTQLGRFGYGTDVPGYGTFCLGFKALPDEYRQWLLNVDDDSAGASLSSLRSLPTVKLPKELWTENTRTALVAKLRVVSLKWKFKCRHHEDNMRFLKALNAVDTFLASVYNACLFEEDAITEVIVAIESLLAFLLCAPFFEEVIAVAEDVYTVLPLEELQSIEIQSISTQFWDQLHLFRSVDRLDRRGVCVVFTIQFRSHIMYMQATKGNHQIALDYADQMIQVIQTALGCGYDESIVQEFRGHGLMCRQDRAVILRLMGKYDEALKELDDILALGENYECLIQTSYLKRLMEDKRGALEYARRAKKVQDDTKLGRPGYGAFCLAFKALPDEYRQWLLNVDDDSAGASPSSVWGSTSVQLPEEVYTENVRTSHLVTQQPESLSCPTVRSEDGNVKLGVIHGMGT